MGKVIDKKTDEKIHHGRREKLRKRIENYGIKSLNECEVLEHLLGIVLPRVDTNPTAHRLIDTFGSLDGVLKANTKNLLKVAGVGERVANFISCQKDFLVYLHDVKNQSATVKTPSDAYYLLRDIMGLHTVEHFVVVCLDVRGNVLICKDISGDIDKVNINVRELLEKVLMVETYSVVFAHNHPDGSARPSDADVFLTRALVHAFAPFKINIIDHIIFGENKHFSFSSQGILDIFQREYQCFSTSKNYVSEMPTNF